MSKFDRFLDNAFRPTVDEDVPTVRIKDTFGGTCEVTPEEYRRFTVPPEIVRDPDDEMRHEMHRLMHPRYTKGSHQYGDDSR